MYVGYLNVYPHCVFFSVMMNFHRKIHSYFLQFISEKEYPRGRNTGEAGKANKTPKKNPDLSCKTKKINSSSLPALKRKTVYQYKALGISIYFQHTKENDERVYIQGHLTPRMNHTLSNDRLVLLF